MSNGNLKEDIILDFLQYVANCVYQVDNIFKGYHHYNLTLTDPKYINTIFDNVEALLTHLGAKLSFDRINEEFFICYDNEISDSISIQQPDIEYSLLEYLKIDNRNDLQRKGEILCTLYKKLESVSDKFKGTEFANLKSDTTFLFNKTGIRHWVEEDKLSVETFEKMDEIEKTLWYDRTYNLFLSCMAVLPYLEIKEEINKIKKVFK